MRGIELLHPAVRQKAMELQALCSAKGLALLITETWRTVAEQDALYAQGRTTSGSIITNAKGSNYSSAHQWGVAFDFCKNVKGAEYSDTAFFKTVGALGKSVGLYWGGDFKSITDMPHFEHPDYMVNNSTATLKAKYGTPEKFKMTWTETKEEEMLTYEEFKAYMDKYSAELAAKSVNANLAAAEFELAKTAKITDGSRPQALVTRQEAAVMAYRAKSK